MDNIPSFSIYLHHAGNMKVWRYDRESLVLSADRYGVLQSITFSGLSASQTAAMVETFGTWRENAPVVIEAVHNKDCSHV